jgi:hypothetical protein
MRWPCRVEAERGLAMLDALAVLDVEAELGAVALAVAVLEGAVPRRGSHA